jgi:hypothetical protein
MSKKQKKMRGQGALNRGQVVNAVSAPEENGTRRNTAQITAAPRRTSVFGPSEFKPDYTPVIKDLKRIGVLAGSFFTLLIILSFFLR